MYSKLHVATKMKPIERDKRSNANLALMTAKRDYARYSRQLILPEVGTEGQSTLLSSSVSVVGCGANGSTILNLLARAGVHSQS
jgi:tRNA A37 threonylcarbamoyladenosine dehydratase